MRKTANSYQATHWLLSSSANQPRTKPLAFCRIRSSWKKKETERGRWEESECISVAVDTACVCLSLSASATNHHHGLSVALTWAVAYCTVLFLQKLEERKRRRGEGPPFLSNSAEDGASQAAWVAGADLRRNKKKERKVSLSDSDWYRILGRCCRSVYVFVVGTWDGGPAGKHWARSPFCSSSLQYCGTVCDSSKEERVQKRQLVTLLHC